MTVPVTPRPPDAAAAPLPVRDARAGADVDPVQPATAYFDAEPPTRRAKLARRGPLYAVEPGGEREVLLNEASTAVPLEYGPTLEVVERRPTSARLRVGYPFLEVYAYARREDLHLLVRDTTPLAAHRLMPSVVQPRADGVFVRPGTVVEGEVVGQHRRVTIEESGLSAHGWLPTSALAHTFVPESWPDRRGGYRLPPQTRIEDEAGQELLVTGDDDLWVQLRREREGRQRIVYEGSKLEIRGWVPKVDTRDYKAWGSGRGTWSAGFGHGMRVLLHRGDRLLAGPEGPVVGRVSSRRFEVRGVRRGPGYEVGTSLPSVGTLNFWVDDETVERGKRWEQAYDRQVRILPHPPAKEVPPKLVERVWRALEVCVTEARDKGYATSEKATLTWRKADHIDVPAGSFAPVIQSCVVTAFRWLDFRASGFSPKLPLSFQLHLDPTPLPPLIEGE